MNEKQMQEIKETFEFFGEMSIYYIMRKYKVTSKIASKFLKSISNDCWLVLKKDNFIIKLVKNNLIDNNV